MNNVSRVAGLMAIALTLVLAGGCASTDTRESTGQYIDSSVITAGVKTALASDDATTLLEIEVETFKDVVQLSGFVDSEEEKTRAGEVAAEVGGVGEVENNLIVKP